MLIDLRAENWEQNSSIRTGCNLGVNPVKKLKIYTHSSKNSR